LRRVVTAPHHNDRRQPHRSVPSLFHPHTHPPPPTLTHADEPTNFKLKVTVFLLSFVHSFPSRASL
jgi:hypothetical protein